MNKKYARNIVVSILIIIISLIGITSLNRVALLFDLKIPSKSNIESLHNRSEEEIKIVLDYIIKNNVKERYTRNSFQEVLNGNTYNVDEEEYNMAIKKLFDTYGYNIISSDDKYINFQVWANMDYGRGMIYSINGTKPSDEYLSQLNNMKERNWFFYESTYKPQH